MIILYIIILAIIVAMLEINIEGRNGWAKNLPVTFKTRRFKIDGKPLTGYHFYLFLLFIHVFHAVFIFTQWSLAKEFLLWGYYFLFFVFEDFFWFLLHKNYGIKRFKKHQIEWHKNWFLLLPVVYWQMIIISIVFLILGGYCGN